MKNEIKLTMNDNYTFQKAEGYEDEPEMNSVEEVRYQLRYWYELLDRMDEQGTLDGDLVQLMTFIRNLADSEIEYEHPLQSFDYVAGIEYYRTIRVYACSKEDADELAKARFDNLARPMTAGTGYAEGLSYLERDFDDFKRIVENDR